MSEFQPSAQVIADSISPWGKRLTTIEVRLHRWVLAEFNTHRMFSRNSASSRAIPVHRTIARMVDEPVYPLAWAGEQSGMQGGPEITDTVKARQIWEAARDDAVTHADRLLDLGVHKSIVNRLLEPFMAHTIIVSATDWDGFWAQRCSPLAQPEIRMAAEAMKTAYDASEPAQVGALEWHLPYLTEEDREQIRPGLWRAVSVARCARVSYLTHDGKRDADRDVDLYFRLVDADPPHASPLEHVAAPCPPEYAGGLKGNFDGWRQLRHVVPLRLTEETGK